MINEYEIKNNYETVLEQIDRAAIKSGRKAEDVTLIAVSKTIDLDRINELLSFDVHNLGENRPQEILEKYGQTKREVNWHLIGQLQTNKVKYIIDKVSMVHSLDRLELANELQKRAKQANTIINCLIQVNISGEESKSGITPAEAIEFCGKVSEMSNVRVRGLMTMAPFFTNKEDCRPVFRGLKNLAVDIERENIHNINMDFLSMGMSNDFEIAIEEGSNMVRVGSAIFGKRNIKL